MFKINKDGLTMSEDLQQRIDELTNENATLKSQFVANSQGIHNLMAQLEATKGELADARIISFQLRTNLVLFEKSNKEISERLKSYEEKVKNEV